MDALYTAGALLRELNTNRLRRLLSILGVIIGTGAVISTLAVVEGGRRQLAAHLEKLGVNLVYLEDTYEHDAAAEPGDLERPGTALNMPVEEEALKAAFKESVMLGGHGLERAVVRPPTLAPDDIAFLRRRFPEAEHVEPQMLHWTRIGPVAGKPIGALLEGSTPGGAVVRRLRVAAGRYLCPLDLTDARRVCVLGAAMAGKLFGATDVVGRELSALGARWTVVGVLEPKGSMMRFDYDKLIVMPLTTLQERTGLSLVNGVLIGARGTGAALRLRRDLLDAVLPRLNRRKPDEFQVFCQDELMEQYEETLGTFKILMVAIAAFSLLVSGIGIMNIMLVSVRERTREIGIWKAVGAADGDVLAYFLGESMLTCLLGGTLGVLLGVFLGAQVSGIIAGAMAETSGWVPVFRIEFVLLSFGTAALVGLLSGLFPAVVAARLEPLEALRYE